MLAHAQIIVAAPDGYRPLAAIGMPPARMREIAPPPLDIDEGAVPVLGMQARQRPIEKGRLRPAVVPVL
jgi:hypothetical protein